MTVRVAEHDWANTPLGPIDRWSPALCTTVENLLGNGFAILLWWGPELVQIYNDAYRPVLGEKHPHALGQRATECWPEIWSTIAPMIEQPLRTGRPSVLEDLALELNRHGFVEETHFSVAYSPVFDEAVPGGIGGVIATVQETTASVVAERRIRLLRELSVRTAEADDPEAICEATASVLAGYPKDVPFALVYLVGDDGVPVLCAQTGDAAVDRDPAHWPLADAALQSRGVIVTESAHRAVVLPMSSGGAMPAGYLVAGVSPRLQLDRTYLDFLEVLAEPVARAIASARAYAAARKRAEALAEIDRAKTAFFSSVSHEFRTPLTLMLGPLEDLRRDASAEQQPLVDSAHRNSLRLLKLVNTLLQFSRLEAGRVDATFVETDLASATADLAGVFRAAIEAAGLRLVIDADLRRPVFVDRSMWEQIVLNLLSNALKFTLTGEIRVVLRERDGMAELTVSDDGVGIPADDLPHVFERFRRARHSAARSHEGSGIGLALVDELVRLHGGTATVESVEGHGSTFRVRLPFGSAHLDPAHVQTGNAGGHASAVREYLADVEATLEVSPRRHWPARVPPAPAARARILVADDNHDLRAYVTHVLSAYHEVVAVRDGLEALEAARAERFDLIVADVMMPRMDGFALLTALRDDDALRAIPVVMLSARAGEEAAIEGLARGANDYLVKPFTADVLLARVNAQLVSTRRLESASFQRWLEHPGESAAADTAFRVFADQLPIMIWQQDPTGAISFTNRTWHRTTGLPHESLSHPLAAWKRIVHPEDFSRLVQAMSDAIAAHGPYELECRIKTVDAGADGYRWYVVRGVPQFDGAGEFRGWIASTVDVHETRLREHELHALADAVPALMWTADASGWIDWYNQRWYDYTGQTPEQARGWGWQAAHHPEDLPRVMDEWPQSIATGRPFEMEFRLRRADDEFRTFLTRAVPVRNRSGEIVRWYGSNIDIHEQKKALDRSKRVAETLQAVFLAADLPHTVRFRADAVYQSAERDALIGGDWYDAVQLPDGRLLLSIGDVTGHGLGASIIAGRLRHAIVDYAMDDADPRSVLRSVNRVLRLGHPDTYATALVAFVDADCTHVTYATAGHPPPLLAERAGVDAVELPAGGLLLGASEDLAVPAHIVPLRSDAVIAFYTDGMTEYGRDVASAEAALRAAVGRLVGDRKTPRPAVAVANAVMRGARPVDDAAVLVVQFSNVALETLDFDPSGLTKTWRFHSSDPRTAQASRLELMKFVRRHADDGDALFTAELILGEILANTVEHAPGLVEVHIDWTGPKPVVRVLDTGPGLQTVLPKLPDDALNEHGRGLFLIETLAEDVQVSPVRGYGTQLRVVLPVERGNVEALANAQA